jgi:Na+-driven multidrug efflux pump
LLNAANGVSQQVMNATQQFTMNFIAAVTPQITKSLAAGEMDYFYKLVIRSSKFCFLISFMIMAPLALQMDFVLSVWLKIVPDYARIFCQLNIINALICVNFGSVMHGIISTGKNKRFRTIDSLMAMLIFPFTYLGLHFSPVGYMCSHIFVNIFKMIYYVLTLRKLTGFSIKQFACQSLAKSFAVGTISIPLPLCISLNMSGWQGFFACLGAFLTIFAISTWFIGLNRSEREKIMELMKRKILYIIN